ncbi:MAG: hypothetical protein WDW38_008823 [Sanguina aurantia]
MQQPQPSGSGSSASKAAPLRPSSATARSEAERKRLARVAEDARKGPSVAAECYIPALKPKRRSVGGRGLGSVKGSGSSSSSKTKPPSPGSIQPSGAVVHPDLDAPPSSSGGQAPGAPADSPTSAGDSEAGAAVLAAAAPADLSTSPVEAVDAGQGTAEAAAAAASAGGGGGAKQGMEAATELDGSSIVIGRRLGSGTFSTVYLARGVVQGVRQQVVVKRLDRMGRREAEEVKNEIHVMTHAGSHPNLVDFKGWYRDGEGMLCLVMGYCGGGTLAELLQARLASTNILLSRNHKVLILGDLGASKQLEGTLQLAITCLGTPLYMSPEVIAGKPYTYAADIWSLGCVLYEIATRRTPFEAMGLPQLMFKILRNDYAPLPPHFSYPFRTLVSQCLNQDPEDRPTITELLSQPVVRKHLELLLGTTDSAASVLLRGSSASALQQQPLPLKPPAAAAAAAGRGRATATATATATAVVGSAAGGGRALKGRAQRVGSIVGRCKQQQRRRRRRRQVQKVPEGRVGLPPVQDQLTDHTSTSRSQNTSNSRHCCTSSQDHPRSCSSCSSCSTSTSAPKDAIHCHPNTPRTPSTAGALPPRTPATAAAAAAVIPKTPPGTAAAAATAQRTAVAAAPVRTPAAAAAAHSQQQQQQQALNWKELRGSSPVVLVPRMAKGVTKYESTAVAHDQKLKQQAEARFLARQYEMRQMRQQVRQARKDKDPAAREREAQLELLQEQMLEKQKRRRTVVAQRSLLQGLLGDGLCLSEGAGGTAHAFEQRERLERSRAADGSGGDSGEDGVLVEAGEQDDDDEILRQWDVEDRAETEALQRIVSVRLPAPATTPASLTDSALYGDGGVELPLPPLNDNATITNDNATTTTSTNNNSNDSATSCSSSNNSNNNSSNNNSNNNSMMGPLAVRQDTSSRRSAPLGVLASSDSDSDSESESDSGDGDRGEPSAPPLLQPILESPRVSNGESAAAGRGTQGPREMLEGAGVCEWGDDREGKGGEDGEVLQETVIFHEPPGLAAAAAAAAAMLAPPTPGSGGLCAHNRPEKGEDGAPGGLLVVVSTAARSSAPVRTPPAAVAAAARAGEAAAAAVPPPQGRKAALPLSARTSLPTPAHAPHKLFRQSAPWSTAPPDPQLQPDPLFTLPRPTTHQPPDPDAPSRTGNSCSDDADSDSPLRVTASLRGGDAFASDDASSSAGDPSAPEADGRAVSQQVQGMGPVLDDSEDGGYSSEEYDDEEGACDEGEQGSATAQESEDEESEAEDEEFSSAGGLTLFASGVDYARGPPSPDRYSRDATRSSSAFPAAPSATAARSPSPSPLDHAQRTAPGPISPPTNSTTTHRATAQPPSRPSPDHPASPRQPSLAKQQHPTPLGRPPSSSPSASPFPMAATTSEPPQVPQPSDPPITRPSSSSSQTPTAPAVRGPRSANADTSAVLELEGRLHSAWLDSDEATRRTFLNHIWQLTLRGPTETGDRGRVTSSGSAAAGPSTQHPDPSPGSGRNAHPDPSALQPRGDPPATHAPEEEEGPSRGLSLQPTGYAAGPDRHLASHAGPSSGTAAVTAADHFGEPSDAGRMEGVGGTSTPAQQQQQQQQRGQQQQQQRGQQQRGQMPAASMRPSPPSSPPPPAGRGSSRHLMAADPAGPAHMHTPGRLLSPPTAKESVGSDSAARAQAGTEASTLTTTHTVPSASASVVRASPREAPPRLGLSLAPAIASQLHPSHPGAAATSSSSGSGSPPETTLPPQRQPGSPAAVRRKSEASSPSSGGSSSALGSSASIALGGSDRAGSLAEWSGSRAATGVSSSSSSALPSLPPPPLLVPGHGNNGPRAVHHHRSVSGDHATPLSALGSVTRSRGAPFSRTSLPAPTHPPSDPRATASAHDLTAHLRPARTPAADHRCAPQQFHGGGGGGGSRGVSDTGHAPGSACWSPAAAAAACRGLRVSREGGPVAPLGAPQTSGHPPPPRHLQMRRWGRGRQVGQPAQPWQTCSAPAAVITATPHTPSSHQSCHFRPPLPHQLLLQRRRRPVRRTSHRCASCPGPRRPASTAHPAHPRASPSAPGHTAAAAAAAAAAAVPHAGANPALPWGLVLGRGPRGPGVRQSADPSCAGSGPGDLRQEGGHRAVTESGARRQDGLVAAGGLRLRGRGEMSRDELPDARGGGGGGRNSSSSLFLPAKQGQQDQAGEHGWDGQRAPGQLFPRVPLRSNASPVGSPQSDCSETGQSGLSLPSLSPSRPSSPHRPSLFATLHHQQQQQQLQQQHALQQQQHTLQQQQHTLQQQQQQQQLNQHMPDQQQGRHKQPVQQQDQQQYQYQYQQQQQQRSSLDLHHSQRQQQLETQQDLSYLDGLDGDVSRHYSPAVTPLQPVPARRPSARPQHTRAHSRSPPRRQSPQQQQQQQQGQTQVVAPLTGAPFVAGTGLLGAQNAAVVADVGHAVLGSLMADIKRWKARRT